MGSLPAAAVGAADLLPQWCCSPACCCSTAGANSSAGLERGAPVMLLVIEFLPRRCHGECAVLCCPKPGVAADELSQCTFLVHGVLCFSCRPAAGAWPRAQQPGRQQRGCPAKGHAGHGACVRALVQPSADSEGQQLRVGVWGASPGGGPRGLLCDCLPAVPYRGLSCHS